MKDVHEVIHRDKLRTINNVCNISGLSYGACQCIFITDLNMMQTVEKFVPHLTLYARQGQK